MTITVDSALANQLGSATGPIELRTPDGHLLGLFMPQAKAPEPNISDEEALRRISDPNTTFYTADEVNAKMREWS